MNQKEKKKSSTSIKKFVKGNNQKKTNVSIKSKAGKPKSKIKTKQKSTQKSMEKSGIKIAFLGGLNEIGKNITLFEYKNDIIILDCGMAFPDGDMPGVDLVIPDFTYILENKNRIKGIVLTHGHEDHIGSLPYLMKELRIPIYGTALTLGLVENKLKEHHLEHEVKLNVVKSGDLLKLGNFTVEFIRVNHSIPDAVAIALHTASGTIVHTGDFKIDCTPTTDEMIDLARFAELGNQGVLALMADSTNAERMGYTMTEQKVYESFERLFIQAEKSRIIIATFASNISRIQQIINCAYKFKRKVAFSGRSMINYMNTAKELGYLNIPDGILIDVDMMKKYSPEEIVVVSTGSQGEPMSALHRMAFSDHKKIAVGVGDFIIISANPIPGNEKMVGIVVDELLKRGCYVVYESMYEVHVSGHACREELKIIQALTKPKYFIPVHGEQKHLKKHAEIALSMGMNKNNIFIGDVGNVVEVSEAGLKKLPSVTAGKVFVDGLGVGDVGNIVLRDRKLLSEDGLIIIVVALDSEDGSIVSGPEIVSRGFVYVRKSEDIMGMVKQCSNDVLFDCYNKNIRDWGNIKNQIRDNVSKMIYEQIHRNPMILPILIDIYHY